MRHASCAYSRPAGSPQSRSEEGRCSTCWDSLLPEIWRPRAVRPKSFRVWREYEVPARRVLGHDASGAPCFCAYDYRLTELRADDDDELYCAVAYGESLKAWRLVDGRWLVHRRLQPFGDEGDLIASFSLDERMPR